mgnify:CR=1 FL=1
MRSLISILDFSVEELDQLIATAKDIIAHPENYRESCKYKKLATLFFEPSTRTRLSFEAAMLELGGSVIGFSSASSSSASKGESVADTAQVISCYADIIAMRHPKEGAPVVAARRAGVPIINAGDGAGQHPTQTLLDLYTIKNEIGEIDNLKIALIGDLKFGRTVHSLVTAMSRYPGVRFVFISPEELRIPEHVRSEVLDANNIPYVEIPLKSDFTIDVNDYIGINKTIFIANPNAPTGIFAPLTEIERVVSSNPESIVIVDEAYIDFGGESALSLIKKYDNLLVTQTFSKSRSMAGARLGFAVGSPELIRDLNTIKYSTNPYNVNRLTLRLGEATVDAEPYYREKCAAIIATRAETAQLLMNFLCR